jgi:D-alanyl-D-alanine carboxypeptidase (penicillin-binding protein 5/6)
MAMGTEPGARRRALTVAVAAVTVVVAVALLAAAPAAPAATKEKHKASGPPKIDARAWILIDPLDGDVLAAHAANRELPVASATKLMTAHLALKRLRPSERLRAPAYHATSSDESLLGLEPGERMTVRDLLYALLLPSANDAALTLAEGVAGSEKRFVREMNREARRLGLTHTGYANPIGLDEKGNYSSARDLVTLASDDLRNRLFARIVDTPSAVLRSGEGTRRVTTRNTLLVAKPWVVGVKTGHTLGAGYVLVGAGRRNGTTLISAALGAPSEAVRDEDNLELLDYGFSLYRARRPVERGEKLADPKLDYRDDHLELAAKRSIETSVRKGQRLRTVIEAPDEVSGAIERGETLGRVVVKVDGRFAGSSPLVAAESVPAATPLQKGITTARQPLLLISLGLFVIVIGIVLARRGRRRAGEAAFEGPDPVEGQPGPRAEPERRGRRGRTPEERRRMHEERMRRREERRRR